MPESSPAVGELLRRAAAGDGDAFSLIYRRHETIVAGFLVRRTRDPEIAADLTAETFAAAIVGVGRFRDEGQSEIGWHAVNTGTEIPPAWGTLWFDANGNRIEHRKKR